MDERFCDLNNGITLCYETFGDRCDPTALLIMGLGTQMVAPIRWCARRAGARPPGRSGVRRC